MARQLRLEYSGACYYVTNRGATPKGIFASDEAAEVFEQVLFETCAKYGWRLYTFVIMKDHFHLALETSEPNLSLGMQWLQASWANRYNRHRGRPFRGRFKGIHVDPEHFLAQVVHFIHLNPVRNKRTKTDQLEEYRWSSLWWFNQRKRPACLHGEPALENAGQLKNTTAGWRLYRKFLAALVKEDPEQTGPRFAGMRRGWILGSPKFRQSILKKMKSKGGLGDSRARQKMREKGWEKRLQEAAAAAKIDLKTLPPKKSAEEKVFLAAVLKASTEAKNAWLSERLQMGTPASASHFVRQFLHASEANPKQVQRLLSKIKA